jgi:DDE superfamily endonuclease
MNPAQLVFVDETGAATNIARRNRRSPRGQRLDGPIPHGRCNSTVDRRWRSTVGGLTTRGFVAPHVLDGAIDGALLKAGIEQMLAPEPRPGDLVVMDNLGAHKVAGIRAAIEAQGAAPRYLPPSGLPDPPQARSPAGPPAGCQRG